MIDDTEGVRKNKAPFPWFGGKSKAAPIVWALLGDVPHYVEPFAGALGVLLERPHPCNRSYFSETINDLDGFVVNAWRGMQLQPEATAAAASWPVSEADKIARQLACLRWKRDKDLEHLMGDPNWCDPVVAGWWLYGICCQIGAIKGPWTADPVTGRIYKQAREAKREEGVSRNRPHLTTDGMGVNRPQLREPGVSRSLPHLSDDGMGVNHAGTREPGVKRNLPHLSAGQGVNRPQLREEGVSRDRPHLSDDGRGVNRPQLREPGVAAEEDQGGEGWAPDMEFHHVTMPELVKWFQWLAARLRHVRIVNGDWKRVCTSGAAKTLPVRQGSGPAGIFLDPPYANDIRSAELYSEGCDCGNVTEEVREWCIKNGPDPQYRIVLAGYDVEHAELESHGWTVHEWFAGGFLSGGYGNIDGSSQQHRERLWASPHCLSAKESDPQMALWGDDDVGGG